MAFNSGIGSNCLNRMGKKYSLLVGLPFGIAIIDKHPPFSKN